MIDATIDEFIVNELVPTIRGVVDGYVSDYPDIAPAGSWPYVGVYTNQFVSNYSAHAVLTNLNDVTIAVVAPLGDLAKVTKFMTPLLESVPHEVYKRFYHESESNVNSDHVQHIGTEIQGTMGPIEWPQGQEMFGILFTLLGVKVQNKIS